MQQLVYFVSASLLYHNILDPRVACEYHLIRTLCDTNCVDLLILANTHTASHLEEACLKFIVTNLATIMSTECWKTKLANHADIMAKILQVTKTKCLN